MILKYSCETSSISSIPLSYSMVRKQSLKTGDLDIVTWLVINKSRLLAISFHATVSTHCLWPHRLHLFRLSQNNAQWVYSLWAYHPLTISETFFFWDFKLKLMINNHFNVYEYFHQISQLNLKYTANYELLQSNL